MAAALGAFLAVAAIVIALGLRVATETR